MSKEQALPLYEIIKRHITEQVGEGHWQVNQRVPSENELCVQFEVSRMTARRALQELTDAGVLFRTKGLGTFVAEPKAQSSLLEIKNIADEIQARGHLYSNEVLSIGKEVAEGKIAISLGLPMGAEVMFSLMVHKENGVPIQLEQRYVNPALVPDYLQQDFTKTTPNEYLSKVAPLSEGEHVIEAILPEVEACAHLANSEFI